MNIFINSSGKLSTTPIIVVLIITVVWNAALYLLPEKDTIWNYLFNICYATLFLYGFFIGIYSTRVLGIKNSLGKALLFLGLGTGAYALATYIWVYYNIVLHVEVPFPSVADVFFLLLAPFMAIGCWNLLVILRSQVGKRYIFESVGIFIAACVIIFGFVYKLEIARNLPVLTNLVNIFYPVGDVVLISLAFIIWRAGGGKIHRGIVILVVGLLLQTIADSLFTYQTSTETYWNGGTADAAWALAGFVFSLAMINLYNDFATHPPQNSSGQSSN